MLFSSDNANTSRTSKAVPITWSRKPVIGSVGERRKGRKNPGRATQIRIELEKRGPVVQVCHRRSQKSSDDLRYAVRSHFAPGKPTESGEGQRHCGIQMSPADLCCQVNRHRDRRGPRRL